VSAKDGVGIEDLFYDIKTKLYPYINFEDEIG